MRWDLTIAGLGLMGICIGFSFDTTGGKTIYQGEHELPTSYVCQLALDGDLLNRQLEVLEEGEGTSLVKYYLTTEKEMPLLQDIGKVEDRMSWDLFEVGLILIGAIGFLFLIRGITEDPYSGAENDCTPQ